MFWVLFLKLLNLLHTANYFSQWLSFLYWISLGHSDFFRIVFGVSFFQTSEFQLYTANLCDSYIYFSVCWVCVLEKQNLWKSIFFHTVFRLKKILDSSQTIQLFRFRVSFFQTSKISTTYGILFLLVTIFSV